MFCFAVFVLSCDVCFWACLFAAAAYPGMACCLCPPCDTHINPVPSHELNSIARLIHEGGNHIPRVTDIKPSTDELVRRPGGGWKNLKEG